MTSIVALWVSALTLLPGPVTGVSIAPDADRTHVAIAVQGDVTVRPFTMEGPHRLVVDLFGARHQLPVESYDGIRRGGIVSIRSTQYMPDVVRIVFELEQPVAYEVVTGPGQVRVSLENRAGTFEPWSTEASSLVRAPATRSPATRSPAVAAPPVRQEPQQPIVDVSFRDTPIQDVLLAFSERSGRSIVAGAGVADAVPTITADIRNQPWDQALRSILRTNGLVAEETPGGIIEVHVAADLTTREAGELLVTRPYKINFARVEEIAAAIEGILSPERGQVAAVPGQNTVIVTDIERVHTAVVSLIQQLDIEPIQVTIQAKIVFVSRTDLDEFGITYDLKDSAGNQLNVISPGAADADGDGIIELPEEQVDIGTNVISLGGNSVAALGNATSRVAGPTLTLLTSLLIGRHTLLSFIEALESTSLSEIQAAPHMTVMDNEPARIMVGERTPIRVIDASAGGGGAAGGGAAGGGGTGAAGMPVASVSIEETGIILETTPHVAGDQIMLELMAERSAPQLAASDAGVTFTTQNATTRVKVRDGQTVVIGGLTVTENNEFRSGIPLLMDLPLIGRLFRVTRGAVIQRDLIILVTPHIVRAPTD
jgi:type IV pilus assembly protein PilQ